VNTLSRLLLCALALLSFAPLAHAIDEQSETQPSTQKSMGDYLSDLEGDSAPDRLYASRVLRGNLRRALHAEATARPGSMRYDDARAALVELEERLPHACITDLAQANVVAACADILAMLDVKEAVPPLQALLATEKRKGVLKHIQAALTTLGSAPPAP
jgi:hypothetical protein